jgi:hypothetical protein
MICNVYVKVPVKVPDRERERGVWGSTVVTQLRDGDCIKGPVCVCSAWC